jgi:hypothetical protein
LDIVVSFGWNLGTQNWIFFVVRNWMLVVSGFLNGKMKRPVQVRS